MNKFYIVRIDTCLPYLKIVPERGKYNGAMEFFSEIEATLYAVKELNLTIGQFRVLSFFESEE